MVGKIKVVEADEDEVFDIKEFKKEHKKQKENEMKNIKSNSTVRTIVTVAITLFTVAAFIATFLAGMNYQEIQNETVKAEAISLSKEMVAESSKENQ